MQLLRSLLKQISYESVSTEGSSGKTVIRDNKVCEI